MLAAPVEGTTRLRDRIDRRVFNAIWSRNLVYNTCWEDPAVDREALRLGADDHVLVITSAGCNALDYALAGARRVDCVDANPRQNALLELKIAAARELAYDDFFAVFGEGRHADFERLYHAHLRRHLSPFARTWWDERTSWFTSRAGSFYFHGLSGLVARAARTWFRAKPRLRTATLDLLEARDLDEQRRIYDERVAPALWSRTLDWAMSRQLFMNMLGVPHPQRRLVEAQHADGVAGFIRDAVRYVFRELPVADNYFWRVYLTGRYARDCCPEYLREANFARLREAVDNVHTHTTTVTNFLRDGDAPITRFVLLDHMDWMASHDPRGIDEEWDAILARAAPGARILLRSAQRQPAWLDAVRAGPRAEGLRTQLHFRDALADALQPRDRVHTYAGFVIADAPV